MNIRQLQYFYLAACYGSFSEAARAEDVSVQAVSKAIIELEEELGQSLFSREGRSISLTGFGKAMVGPAREAVASFDAVGRAAESYGMADGDASQRILRIMLVSPPFAKYELVCSALSQLISHMIGTKTHIAIGRGADALADLRAGNIDALITIGAFSNPRCVTRALGNVSVGAFMGKKHPLRRKRLVSFDDLEPYPVLFNKDIDSFNDTILSACQRNGLSSDVVEIQTDAEVADFLEYRDGYVLGVYLKALDIKPLAAMHKIDPADAPPIPICVVTLKGKQGEKYERLDRFVSREFSLLKRMFNE